MSTPTEQRFFTRVDKGQNDESCCWNWTGGKSWNGYGLFRINGKPTRAHRFLVQPIPVGKLACHHCDNRLCVRPSHIFIGTHKDNALDCTRKGRMTQLPKMTAVMAKIRHTISFNYANGERNAAAKLTTPQVLLIRQSDKSLSALSKEYHVSISAISGIKLRRTWRHIK